MLNKEARQRLFAIGQMCQEMIDSGYPIMAKTDQLLKDIIEISKGGIPCIPTNTSKTNKHIILSCSSISTEDKKGIGAVFEVPNEKELSLNFDAPLKDYLNTSITAIYQTIFTFANLKNSPRHFIEVRNDCREAVELINSTDPIEDELVREKVEEIRELVQSIPVPLILVWLPSNSTSSLRKAYQLALY